MSLFKIALEVQKLLKPLNVLKELLSMAPLVFLPNGIETYALDTNNTSGNHLRIRPEAFAICEFPTAEQEFACNIKIVELLKGLRMTDNDCFMIEITVATKDRSTLCLRLYGAGEREKSFEVKVQELGEGDEQYSMKPPEFVVATISVPLAPEDEHAKQGAFCFSEMERLAEFNTTITMSTEHGKLQLSTPEGCKSTFDATSADSRIRIMQEGPISMTFQWSYLSVYQRCRSFAKRMRITASYHPDDNNGIITSVTVISRPVRFHVEWVENLGIRGDVTMVEMSFLLAPLA